VKHAAIASHSDVFDLALRRVAARPLDMAGPYFVPYLDGSRDNPVARGGWVNVSSWNDEDSLLGAVIEGVCMEHRHHLERLPVQAPLPLVLSGGATKSAAWSQRFADVTGCQVRVSESQELGAVGVASVAALGVGLVEDLEEALGLLCPDAVVLDPDPDVVAFYDERYATYLSIASCLEQLPRREPARGA
jgi:L-xylulokinase